MFSLKILQIYQAAQFAQVSQINYRVTLGLISDFKKPLSSH